MSTKMIQKATSRGQITMPIAWRKKFKTNNYLVETGDSFLRITPFDIEDATDYNIVFDADRDNGGEDIFGEEIINMIDKINGQSRKIFKKSSQKATAKN